MALDVRGWRGSCQLALCLTLCACTPTLLNYESPAHVVRAGETLYTIAWQHGVDYRELARWNSLRNPDLIFAGQRLRLRPPGNVSAGSPTRSLPEREPASSSAPVRLPAPAILPEPVWFWPTQGEIAARFGAIDGIGTGIAVAGRGGQAINAAAGGRVVYVGTGLAGYGQLVIVKHNDTYLSAYGHTEGVAVNQGDWVDAGAQIASMGIGPRRQARLHFEIRRNGEPIDPLAVLPAKR